MYQLDVIKTSQLAKKLGGPPIFHDGFLHAVTIDKTTMTLDIKILSQNNPTLEKDTRVLLKLQNLHAFSLQSPKVEKTLMVIHDLEIRREGEVLHLILEGSSGEISEVIFDTIELSD